MPHAFTPNPFNRSKAIFSKVLAAIKRRRRRYQLAAVYNRYRDFTMISDSTYVDNLLLAERVADLPGCVVECGVWRGGMSAGLVDILGKDRDYFLFDSFEGLPPAQEIDGRAALAWQKDTTSPGYFDNCCAPSDYAERAMKLSGAQKFTLVPGWFDKTLPSFVPPSPIALLRLDADWYESTIICLETLFPHLIAGGLLVLDDYHTWDGCSRALHDFLSKHEAAERIRSCGDICYVEKLRKLS